MKSLNCLIIDDEELARTLLEKYVDRVPHINLISKCSSPIEAMQIIQQKSIDLIFLDIQMPEMLGTDFLKTLPNHPMVIFTTAYTQYAIEGYELNIVDYLLKPFRFERFMQAINKAYDLAQLKNKEAFIPKSSTSQPTNSDIEHILIKSEHKVHRVTVQDIIYIQSMREYVTYYTTRGKYMSIGSLKQLELDLPSKDFIRVHKSYIIAKSKVKTLEGNLLHVREEKIPIGASYKETVLRELFSN